MKKIIIGILLVVMFAYSGCNEDEVMELISENENGAVDIKSDTEQKAENIETNDSQSFVVYVAGCVKRPGVYELENESRVIDALDAAGGYSNEASDMYLNLASPVTDGQMIYVPSKDEVSNQNTTIENIDISNSSENNKDLVDINSASREQLMTLPGIGESKAEKIIAYREQNGRFSSPEKIMEISGIKDGLYNKIKDRICAK